MELTLNDMTKTIAADENGFYNITDIWRIFELPEEDNPENVDSYYKDAYFAEGFWFYAPDEKAIMGTGHGVYGYAVAVDWETRLTLILESQERKMKSK